MKATYSVHHRSSPKNPFQLLCIAHGMSVFTLCGLWRLDRWERSSRTRKCCWTYAIQSLKWDAHL